MKKLLLTAAAAATLTLSLASCDAGLTKEQKAFYDACADLPVAIVKLQYGFFGIGKNWSETDSVGSMCRTMALEIPDLTDVKAKLGIK